MDTDETLGTVLARDRLELRARRLEATRSALYERASAHANDGYRLPAPLRLALADFTLAVGEVREELEKLKPGRFERSSASSL